MSNETDNLFQIANVEQPFGADPTDVHCPICGQSTRKVCQEHEVSAACAHLAFIYVDDIAEYEYMSPAFVRRIESVGEEETEEESGEDALRAHLALAGYGRNLLVLRITFSGVGCGPFSLTASYGFDYDTLLPEKG